MSAIVPTADDVATAIVAACRETGEDPLSITDRNTKLRARHYAMHALARVFPNCPKKHLAKYVGAPIRSDKFWDNSRLNVFEYVAGREHQKAKWWSAEIFARVVRAVEASRTRSAVTLPARKPLTFSDQQPTSGWGGVRGGRRRMTPKEAARAAEAVILGDKPPPSRFEALPAKPAYERPPLTDRRALYDDLAKAAANTAKLQAGE